MPFAPHALPVQCRPTHACTRRFRQYLFAAQARLLLRLGRPIDVAERGLRFVDATAVIRNGAVEVSSPAVPAPVAVRYAWANAPEATLVNGEGLPSFPFRSDDWPVTADT